jgi:hypothetical protein
MFRQNRGDSEADEEPGTDASELVEFYRLLFPEDDEVEFYANEDGEGPFEALLQHASEVEAGLIPGWKLDRSHPGALVWTTPSGRRYKSTLDGSYYVPHPH